MSEPKRTGMFRGHAIHEVERDYWAYPDGSFVFNDPTRACGFCGRENTPEGFDGCIGEIPGAVNACCGHGVEAEAFVIMRDKREFRGAAALRFMERLAVGGAPTACWSPLPGGGA